MGLNYAIGAHPHRHLLRLFACDVLGWFITDAHTLEIAHELLMITLWSYLLFGNSAVLSGVMRGSGTVIVPTANGDLRDLGRRGSGRVRPDAPSASTASGWAIRSRSPPAYHAVLYYKFVWKKKTHERLGVGHVETSLARSER